MQTPNIVPFSSEVAKIIYQNNREIILSYMKDPNQEFGRASQKQRNIAVFDDYVTNKTTLKKVGDKHGISPERCRQIIQKGLRISYGIYRRLVQQSITTH